MLPVVEVLVVEATKGEAARRQQLLRTIQTTARGLLVFEMGKSVGRGVECGKVVREVRERTSSAFEAGVGTTSLAAPLTRCDLTSVLDVRAIAFLDERD